MKRWIPLFLILLGMNLFPETASSRSIPLTEYNALRHVEIAREGEDLLMRFDFKNPIKQKLTPHYFKRSVQLDFSLTYVDPPKRHYAVEGSPITQVYVSQFDSRLMRVRFILADENGLGRGDFSFQKEGRSLEVRVKSTGSQYDAELDQLIQRAVGVSSGRTIKETPAPEIQSTIAEQERQNPAVSKIKRLPQKTPVKEVSFAGREVEPIGELKESEIPVLKKSTPLKLKDKKQEPVILTGSDKPVEEGSLWGSAFKMLSTLAFVVGLMFLLFYAFKKLVAKQGMFGTAEKPIRVISTGFLGPKKSIAMVEVAGRILILGVANDQITLLSSLEDEEEVSRIIKSGGKEKKRTNEKIEEALPSEGKAGTNPDGHDGKPDIYTRKKSPQKPDGKPKQKKLSGPFSKYVKQFSKPEAENNQAVNDLKRMIRQRSGKVNVGA